MIICTIGRSIFLSSMLSEIQLCRSWHLLNGHHSGFESCMHDVLKTLCKTHQLLTKTGRKTLFFEFNDVILATQFEQAQRKIYTRRGMKFSKKPSASSTILRGQAAAVKMDQCFTNKLAPLMENDIRDIPQQ